MRSESVVLPESMCALIPMLRNRFRSTVMVPFLPRRWMPWIGARSTCVEGGRQSGQHTEQHREHRSSQPQRPIFRSCIPEER
jgi:hypothetical protein